MKNRRLAYTEFSFDCSKANFAKGEKDDRSFLVVEDVTVSDESVNSYGMKVKTGGWDLLTHKKNPILLWNHRTAKADDVIGSAKVRVEGKELRADLEFEPGDLNPEAEKIARKMEYGTIKAFSVGFDWSEWHWEKADGGEILVIDKAELVELSVVPIGANRNALRNGRDGETLRDLLLMERDGERKMKSVSAALGLALDATEEMVLDAVRKLQRPSGLLGKLGVETEEAALGAIDGLLAAKGELEAAKAREGKLDKQEREILLSQNAKKLTPDQLTNWAPNQSTAQLRGYFEHAPDLHQGIKSSPSAEMKLSAEEMQVAKQMGISPEDFAKTKQG